MSNAAPVALTGATGFIGTALCKHLRQLGHPVTALVRSPDSATALTKIGVTAVAGDLSNRASLQRLIDNQACVIHCAASVRGRSLESFLSNNVDGTRLLIEAVEQSNSSPRFLFLSSLAAREPDLSWYAQSKHRAEQALATSSIDCWTVLRPPPVYGPGDKEMLPIFRLMKRGTAILGNGPESRISLLHVDDLIGAIVACMHSDNCNRATYTPVDPMAGGYDWYRIAAIASEIFARPVHLRTVPAPLLNSFARINLALAGLLNYEPMLTPSKLRELRHPDWVADASSLQRDTLWSPQIDLHRGLSELAKSAL